MQSTSSFAVELQQIKEVLRHYCQGLTARDVQVLSTKELTDKGIGWASNEKPATEGRAIFLPSVVDEFSSELQNFSHYKVLATHQAAHLEFGTFDFSFSRSSSLFADVRLKVQEQVPPNRERLSDFQRFFDLFPDRRLASDIFMVVEDTRVDYLLKHEYRGIRHAYERAQQKALERRPDINSLPLREAFMEILIQLSIENWGFYSVPKGQSRKLSSAISILRRVRSRRSAVEDSAEATIRIFNLLNETENVNPKGLEREDWDSADTPDHFFEMDDDLDDAAYKFSTQGDGTKRPRFTYQSEEPYNSPRDIDFRGGIKPELVQALNQLRQGLQNHLRDSTQSVSAQALQKLFDDSVEIELKDSSEAGPMASYAMMQNILKEQGKMGNPPDRSDIRALLQGGQPSGVKPVSQALDSNSFLYDEWDFVASEYKPRWCHLKRRLVEEGSTGFYAETVKNHVGLVTGVRREFERLRNERLKKIRRLQDGEEFDFDAVIDAVVERKAGAAPNDKVYWRRNKIERDVCVVFLLDMSASTYESISGGYRLGKWEDGDAGEISKRIIDVEKESIVILVEALQAIGDSYGIYGFSGHGKDSVEFFVIKDILEDMSKKVKQRIDKIAPAQETRMGPAIRHATSILAELEYRTKLLLLVSDGRPQDHDYGAHHFRGARNMSWSSTGNDPLNHASHSYDRFMKEYAVYDTRMALLEAKQRSIVPFCLTVDKRGHDYLKAMCGESGEIGYEVMDDISSLPKRLPALYRSLTT